MICQWGGQRRCAGAIARDNRIGDSVFGHGPVSLPHV
jgi:hypothetical protein